MNSFDKQDKLLARYRQEGIQAAKESEQRRQSLVREKLIEQLKEWLNRDFAGMSDNFLNRIAMRRADEMFARGWDWTTEPFGFGKY